jgi:hypothetical protein
MAFLFGGRGRQKSPAEIAKALKELLYKLWEPTINPKVEEEAAKYMAQMKLIVQGTPGETRRQDTVGQVVLMIWYRGGLQPRTGAPAGVMHHPRRHPLRTRPKHTAAPLRSPEGCPDHLLPYPAI